MGCEGSKVDTRQSSKVNDEYQRLKQENVLIKKELNGLKQTKQNEAATRPSQAAAPNNEPASTTVASANGMGASKASIVPTPLLSPRRAPGFQAIQTWRDKRLAIGIDSASENLGQCDDLFLSTMPSFEDSVAQALRGGCDYKISPDDRFLPSGVTMEGAIPLTTAAVVKAAKRVSTTHPALAAHTLVSPLCVEGTQVMQAASLPSTDPYGDASDEYVKRYRAYETLLNAQLLSIAPHVGVCYKAVPTRGGNFSTYSAGNVVTWCSPASASILPSVAARGLHHADDEVTGTFLVIQSIQGREIDRYSAHSAEREVLFPANTQFRTSSKISSAITSILQHELKCAMSDVEVLTLCEIRLVVWRDVLSAMDEVETTSCPELVELIEQASQTSEAGGRYARDIVTGSYILGCPMTELPPRATGGATVVHLVAGGSELVGLLRMVTHHLCTHDINELNADGRSPLHLALAHNNIIGAVHLLRNGAAVASLAAEADMALAAAISHTWKAGIEQSIVERIVNEVPSSDLESVVTSKLALRAAAGLGKMSEAHPLLQFLCQKGKAGQHLKYLDTAGMIAEACASPNVDEAFITYLVKDAQAKDSGAAVREAMEAGNLNLLAHMKRLGLSLDGVVTEGRTAMHLAAQKGDLDGLVALKEAGADFRCSDSFGWTLAHEAAYNNHVHLLDLLRKWGANLDDRDVDGCTPLWWAADSGYDAIIRMLHKNGADPRVADSTDGTAVLIAAYNGRGPTVRLLHSIGADINKPDNRGRTPAWLAAGSGSLPVLQELQQLGAKLGTADKEGLTAVHVAAQEGWADVLTFLNDNSVNLESTDHMGRTPLHYAAAKSRFKCIVYLVKAGVNVACVSDDPNLGSGCMPVHMAATKLSFEAHPYEFSLLINSKSVNAMCKSGAPLDIAHSYNRVCHAKTKAPSAQHCLCDKKTFTNGDYVREAHPCVLLAIFRWKVPHRAHHLFFISLKCAFLVLGSIPGTHYLKGPSTRGLGFSCKLFFKTHNISSVQHMSANKLREHGAESREVCVAAEVCVLLIPLSFFFLLSVLLFAPFLWTHKSWF